ncbi:TadE family protein [Kitasatospora sp. NPDC092286]|uniref:TadE family protein n=1 Tax=Kitasatospora sp. NPDC092286 TaxID=3364087 RepID=UPI00382A558C
MRRSARWWRTTRARRSARGRDGGGVAIEAAIVAPGVVGLILVAIAAGRVQTTAGTVEAAARSAARTVSMARGVESMRDLARTTAVDTLRQQGVDCRGLDVQATDGQIEVRGRAIRTVKVTVRCDVGLDDLLFGPRMPLTKHLVGEFTSVLDRYRGE